MAFVTMMAQTSGGQMQRTCRICKRQYTPATNHYRACRFHPGPWMGAENSKHHGIGPKDPGFTAGVSYFYDCCAAEDKDAPGCSFGYHQSYDD